MVEYVGLDGHFLSLMIMTCVLVFSAVVDETFIVSVIYVAFY